MEGDRSGATKKPPGRGGFRERPISVGPKPHLILVSLNSTCLRAIGSYFFFDIFSVIVREFFFVNRIDFHREDLFTLVTSPRAGRPTARHEASLPTDEDLVLVSGGKDSAFTLEFLRETGHPVRALYLNPSPAAREVAAVAGVERGVVVNRTLDPAMLELNRRGYLNGHTPFSAYLAFLGATCAVVYG